MNKSLFTYITFTFSAVGITGVFFFFVFAIQNRLNHKKKIHEQNRHDSLDVLDLKIKRFLDENHVGYSSKTIPPKKQPTGLGYVKMPSERRVYVLTDRLNKVSDIEQMANENMYVARTDIEVFDDCVKIKIFEVV